MYKFKKTLVLLFKNSLILHSNFSPMGGNPLNTNNEIINVRIHTCRKLDPWILDTSKFIILAGIYLKNTVYSRFK